MTLHPVLVNIVSSGYRCMPAPHALYSKMLAERTASRNVLVLICFNLFCFLLCGASSNGGNSLSPSNTQP